MGWGVILAWKNQNACETDYRIRFIVLWNGICIPFHKKICKFFYETDYRIRFTVLWNGICNPFHKKICNFFWNGIQIPFHNTVKRILYSVSKKIANFCMKRITESVSHAFWFFHAKITPHPINFKPYSHVLMFVAGSGMLPLLI